MLLDTNAYSALAQNRHGIISVLPKQGSLYLCPPVVAELRFGFKLGSREQENEKNLQRFLAVTGMLDVTVETTSIYSEIAAFVRRGGFVLSHNDLWIAALAKQYDAKLLTYDQDFAPLRDILGENLLVLRD